MSLVVCKVKKEGFTIFVEPLSEFNRLAKKVEEEEEYEKVLYLSMEALSYLPGAVQESKRKGGNKIKNYQPVRYAFSYLAALQEEEDFNRIKKIINKINFPEEIRDYLIPKPAGKLIYRCLQCGAEFGIRRLLYICPDCGHVQPDRAPLRPVERGPEPRGLDAGRPRLPGVLSLVDVGVLHRRADFR